MRAVKVLAVLAIAALAIGAATSFTAWAETEVRVIATGEPYGAAMKGGQAAQREDVRRQPLGGRAQTR